MAYISVTDDLLHKHFAFLACHLHCNHLLSHISLRCHVFSNRAQLAADDFGTELSELVQLELQANCLHRLAHSLAYTLAHLAPDDDWPGGTDLGVLKLGKARSDPDEVEVVELAGTCAPRDGLLHKLACCLFHSLERKLAHEWTYLSALFGITSISDLDLPGEDTTADKLEAALLVVRKTHCGAVHDGACYGERYGGHEKGKKEQRKSESCHWNGMG